MSFLALGVVPVLAAWFAIDAGAPAAAVTDGGIATPDATIDGAPAGPVPPGNADAGMPAAATPPPETRVTPMVPAPSTSPSAELRGRVLAKGGRKAVAGVSLVVDGTEVGVTDARGDFAFVLPCGPRKLSLQSANHEVLNLAIDACRAGTAPLTLRLEPKLNGPAYETVVRTKPLSHAAVQLSEAELVRAPGTLGDPVRVIESLPGLSSVLWPASIYAVRGSNPGNTGFFLDGVRIPALFHLALGPSVIHPYFFRGLDFYPGSYPARFGRYVGGIVSAETRPPAMDDLHASVDVRLFDAGAMVSAPLAGGAVAAAARYSYTGALVSQLSDKIQLSYWDYQLRADRRVGPFQLTLLAFGSRDAYSPDRTDPKQELNLGFHRLSLRAAVALAGGVLEGSVVLGKDHSRAEVLDTFPILVDAASLAPRLSYARSFGPVAVAAGLDGELATYDPLVMGGAAEPEGDWDLARHRNVKLLAGYLTATATLGRAVTVTPEVRLDRYDVNGTVAHDLGPRLATTIAVNETTALKLTGGRFTQLPTLPLQIPGAEAFGLRRLGLQSSWQGSAGVESARSQTLKVSATAYVQHAMLSEIRNPTDATPDPLADDFLARREALAYGLELLLRRPTTERLHGWISYTLSNSQRAYGGGAVGPSNWDQRHVLNVVLGYRFDKTIVGGRAHFNSGRPYFLHDTAGDEYIRLPSYYQVDLRVDHPVYFDRLTLNLYAELVNATFHRQVYGFYQGTRSEIGQRSTRIVLPSVGVRAEF